MSLPTLSWEDPVTEQNARLDVLGRCSMQSAAAPRRELQQQTACALPHAYGCLAISSLPWQGSTREQTTAFTAAGTPRPPGWPGILQAIPSASSLQQQQPQGSGLFSGAHHPGEMHYGALLFSIADTPEHSALGRPLSEES